MKELRTELSRALLSMEKTQRYARTVDKDLLDIWEGVFDHACVDAEDVWPVTLEYVKTCPDWPAAHDLIELCLARKRSREWDAQWRTDGPKALPAPMTEEQKNQTARALSKGPRALLAVVTGDLELAKSVLAEPDEPEPEKKPRLKMARAEFREPTEEEIREAGERKARVMAELEREQKAAECG